LVTALAEVLVAPALAATVLGEVLADLAPKAPSTVTRCPMHWYHVEVGHQLAHLLYGANPELALLYSLSHASAGQFADYRLSLASNDQFAVGRLCSVYASLAAVAVVAVAPFERQFSARSLGRSWEQYRFLQERHLERVQRLGQHRLAAQHSFRHS
jgi:hypothetical protein